MKSTTILPPNWSNAMNDIDEILAWHKQTFPEFSSRNQETKLNEEIGEYHAAIDTVIETGLQSDLEKVREELADVIITAINMMRYPEIQTLVKDKMAINLKRTWKDGHHN